MNSLEDILHNIRIHYSDHSNDVPYTRQNIMGVALQVVILCFFTSYAGAHRGFALAT